jgi:hypothetical protein
MEQTTAPGESNADLPAVLYFFGRMCIFLALIPASYSGAGDLAEYMAWAGLPGWPYVHYWVEFPPLFPLLNAGLFKAAGGQTFPVMLWMAILFALAGAVCLVWFRQVAARLWGGSMARQRTWVFLALLLPLPYTWWYFDLLPLAALLLAMLWLLEGHTWRSGLAVGVGLLLKWFPGLLLASAWRFRPARTAGKISAAAIGLTAVVLTGFALASPQMTAASLRAQSTRSSWETAWALLDGNMTTGAFLRLEDRLDPAFAGATYGNPAVIPGWVSLLAFGALGAWLFWRARAQTPQAVIAFLGLTWVVFLAWSPGWSPQWVLYLIPLILLTLPLKRAVYAAGGLILLNLVEWPTLMGHGISVGLFVIVPLRLLIFAWLGRQWYRLTRDDK